MGVVGKVLRSARNYSRLMWNHFKADIQYSGTNFSAPGFLQGSDGGDVGDAERLGNNSNTFICMRLSHTSIPNILLLLSPLSQLSPLILILIPFPINPHEIP